MKIDQFNKRMGTLASRVPKNADRIVRKAALAIDQTVVMATPVDQGRARANWIAALDAAVETPTDDKDPSGAKAMSQAAGVIAQYDGDAHSEIHITNNLPYIGPLNDGSSRQAPAGFVQQAVKDGAGAVQGAKLLEE
jgi:hypothetical protein